MYIATILCLATGEKRDCAVDCEWDADTSPFAWDRKAGNFGCDCNRHILFTGDSDADMECSTTHYIVERMTLADGTVIEIDK